ncbi:MAG: heavy metal-binding domain-containing protein [Shewanella sp.]
MKTLPQLALAVLMMACTGVFATETPRPHQHSKADSQQQAHTHACPMDPDVTGNQGDSCPKCGMDLEPLSTEASTTQETHKGHQHH